MDTFRCLPSDSSFQELPLTRSQESLEKVANFGRVIDTYIHWTVTLSQLRMLSSAQYRVNNGGLLAVVALKHKALIGDKGGAIITRGMRHTC